jgi:hypothetical protein
MQQDIGVGMSQQTGFMRNRHAADNQWPASLQGMAIITLADTKPGLLTKGLTHAVPLNSM